MIGRKFTVGLSLVLLIMMLSSCVCDESECPQAVRPQSKEPEVRERTPVIFDTDIGDDIDDTWALAFLLQCPELDVKLITTELGDSESQVKIVAKMLSIAGRTDIPIGRGIPYRSEQGHNQDQWIEDYNLSSYPGIIYADGIQAIIDTIMNSPEPITVIAVGPLPNIAEALRCEPKIAQKARFIGMHGSIRKGYGGSDKHSAEYNVRAVAEAAQKVFTSDWDMMITPLDTCGIVKLDGEKYQKVLRSNRPLAQAVMENYLVWMDAHRRLGKTLLDVNSTSSTLYDTVAVYLAVSRRLVKMEKLGILVTDDGYTVIDEKAKEINCAVEWKDLDAFEDFLIGRLTK